MVLAQHENLVLIKNTMRVEGKEPIDFQILGVEAIHVKIPEGTKYRQTLQFEVKGRKLKNFRLHQEFKKAGITVRTRDLEFGEYEESEEPLTVDYPEDETPSGFFARGVVHATSMYYDGDELLISHDWTLEIVKK